MTEEERRSHPRIHFDQKVSFSTDCPIHEGFTYNLSPNGVSLISDLALPDGANIKVNIHLTNYSLETDLSDEIVTVEGKVVWVTQKQKQTVKMGMEFIKPNATLLKYYMKNAAEL